MAEDTDNQAGTQPDELDRYRTKKRSEVVSNLVELSRSVEPLTVLFDEGKHSFPTSVIDLIADNTEVVIERSSSQALNERLLRRKRGTVVGQPGGIRIRFVLEDIRAAEHEGEQVLIAPLPSEHYRMQRRRQFRIDTMFSNPVKVTLTPPGGEEITLSAGNISAIGLRLDDVDRVLECSARQVLQGCTVQIPDMEPFQADLEVRNSYEKTGKNGKTVHYVGCKFKDLGAGHERDIQNYINLLQLSQRAGT